MATEVLVVQTGTANTASVLAGLKRAGASPRLTKDPQQIYGADRVVLPGVGALAAAMTQLQDDGLDEVIKLRVRKNRPTLAICLGLQLLCRQSQESPGTEALGLLDTEVFRFPDSVSVPQMGWNQIDPGRGCRYLRPGFAYFANSYRLADAPEDWNTAWSDHGGAFVAALEKGDVVACQFHPELSGSWGQDLLARWVDGRPEGGSSC